MKLVWHIFLKDLRRLARPLALWSTVIGLQFLAWCFARMGESAGENPGNLVVRPWELHRLLWGVQLVTTWALVPWLIHDDPLIGDHAGWRVRPISGARLLAAKILGMLVLFCLWPSLLTVPWWLGYGFGLGEIVRAVAVNLLGMALFTGVALMVAVLTENFARFLAWSLVLAAAVGLGGLLIVAEMPASSDGAVSAALLITRAGLACGVVLAAAAVVVPMQFLRRRTTLARGLVAVAMLGAALVVQAWPWSAAQMLARTGMKKYSLPAVTARAGHTTLLVPSGSGRQQAGVRVTTEFAMKGLAAGDLPTWREAEPKWRIGDSRGPDLPRGMDHWPNRWATAVAVARGDAGPRDEVHAAAWQMDLSGRLVPQLRSGGAVLSARNLGAIWRGEAGPAVALRAGAGAARGLEQMHVNSVGMGRNYYEDQERVVQWVQTGPLFTPAVMLQIMNLDGMDRHRRTGALLMNGKRAFFDETPNDDHWENRGYLPPGRIPVGMIGVRRLSSSFDQSWWRGSEMETGEPTIASYFQENRVTATPVPLEGSTLTSVTFEEAAPLEVTLAETPFLPNLIVEGRLDEALRRAKTEGKLVLVRVPALNEKEEWRALPGRWNGWRVRDFMVARFVVVLLGQEEAGRFRKGTADDDAPVLVVLKAGGEEQDRLRDLDETLLLLALRANGEGKTYAAVLTEALAARGGDDRRLRVELHEALRARGDLSGAFDAILWVVDHPAAPFEGAGIFEVGRRLERFVATYGPAKAALLERREQAVANLRKDPRDVGAARLLLAITMGLRHDDGVWQEFPRLMPRENPLWWESTRNWVSVMVQDKRYREAVGAVDLEKFFAEGPAWVRAQLMQKRVLYPNNPPAAIGDWQRMLMRAGTLSIEALAGAGQADAALRLAVAALRVNSSESARWMLVDVLRRAGAKAEAERLLKEKSYAH